MRNSSKGDEVTKHYPKARVVQGDLDSYDVIRDESAKADIVCNFANCDHEGAVKAIVDGLASSHGSKKYLIHTCGTAILLAGDYGELADKSYDDWDGVAAVTSLPDSALHRTVDKIVLAANSDSLQTAIVCPPTIYGPGRGPSNQTSQQIPGIVKLTLGRGKGWVVGRGRAVWNAVHVRDLSDMYVKLVGAAVKGDAPKGTFGKDGYYFAENREFAWGVAADEVAAECHRQGLIESADVENLTVEQVDELAPGMKTFLGLTSRGKAIRAQKLLGWQAKAKSIEEEMPGLVKQQAAVVGKTA